MPEQIDMEDWNRKTVEGLEGKEPEPENDDLKIDKTALKDSPKLEGIPVVLSGGHPTPELENMPALNTTHIPAKSKPIVHGENSLTDTAYFEHMQRVASAFSKSKLLPTLYQNDAASCFVAVHMAARMNIDPFTFMQNSYVVQGKPALEGKLMIALLNARGGYIDGIEYEYSGEGDDYGCRAYGTLRNGKVHEARVDIKLAKAEGWYQKNPKWKNMPDQMLAYRSAAFLLRKYRPELLMGLQTYEEVEDVNGVIVQSPVGSYRRSALNDVVG